MSSQKKLHEDTISMKPADQMRFSEESDKILGKIILNIYTSRKLKNTSEEISEIFGQSCQSLMKSNRC